MRVARLLFVCSLLTALLAAPTAAAQRMWIGFQDDPSLRWREDRIAVLDRVAAYNASMVRTTVYWSRIAPTRPASAANPFDPAYRFDDLDEFVRGAATRGMAVMLTIWGTPTWANGGKGQNIAPRNFKDLENFARAVAGRYNGRRVGLPFVHFYTVWNESNLGQFLAPQFANGTPSSPFIYAKIYRAVYTGVKAANSKALVGIGETSPRGRDKPLGRLDIQETMSPGRFAQLLSTVRPKLKFDAWSHHPYSELGRGPTQRVRFPNVNLAQMPLFARKLDAWFGRKNIPIWVTEHGFETKPGEPKGVTVAQQAAYLRQALAMVRRDPRVQMYIWFIFRDDPTSTWQSGLVHHNNSEKPAANVFPALARLLDARNPVVTLRAGLSNPVVRVPVFEIAARSGIGTTVFSTARAFIGSRLVGVAQPAGVVAVDGYASFTAPIPRLQKGVAYSVTFDMNDPNGNRVFRTVTVIAR